MPNLVACVKRCECTYTESIPRGVVLYPPVGVENYTSGNRFRKAGCSNVTDFSLLHKCCHCVTEQWHLSIRRSTVERMRQHRTTQRTRQCTCFKSVSPFAPTRYSKSNLLHTSNSHYIFRCSSYSSELHPYQIVNYLGFLPKQQIIQNIFQNSPFFHRCTNRTLENNRLLIGRTHLTHSYLLN